MTFNQYQINGEYIFEILDSDGKVIGEAVATMKNDKYWCLDEIVVDKDERNKSYGTQLLNHLRESLWSINRFPIRVHPGLDPETAINAKSGSKGDNNKIQEWYYKRGFTCKDPNRKQLWCYP
jgi:GNAT superfamily N-acetyltransferase